MVKLHALRIWLPLVMVLHLAVALVRVEIKRQWCGADVERICMKYPHYLSYGVQQQVDLHWLAISPVMELEVLPQLRWLLAIGGCAVVWFGIARWIETLRDGGALSARGKIAKLFVVVLTVVVAPIILLSALLGIRGGWEGSAVTAPSLVIPLVVAVLGWKDLGWRPPPRVGLACLLALFYYVAAEPLEDPAGIAFEMPFSRRPETMEALGVHAPAILLLLVPAALFRVSITEWPWNAMAAVVIGGYWFVIFTLMGPGLQRGQAFVSMVRPWLLLVLLPVASLLTLSWLAGNSNHGSTPVFGAMVGMWVAIYALRRAGLTLPGRIRGSFRPGSRSR